MKLKAKQ